MSGEEVTYTYDCLNRLIGAMTTGPEWGNSYTYDGWGNLTAKTVTKGSAPSWSNAVDPATNRLVGQLYDAAGNNGWPEYFDGWGRPSSMVSLIYVSWPSVRYDAFNKRVTRLVNSLTTEEIIFYGIDGRKMETFRWQFWEGPLLPHTYDVYFAGRQIIADGRWVTTDRLGSVRRDSSGQRYDYYPYGEERTSTPNDQTKFATYFRDEGGLDYADQRYYAHNQGRFLTPDPYRASAGLTDPGSWNRYAYVQGDPINGVDPRGLKVCREDDQFYLCGHGTGDYEYEDDAADGSSGPISPTSSGSSKSGVVASFDATYKGQSFLAVAALHTPCRQALAKLGVSMAALSSQALTTNYVDATQYDSDDATLTQHRFFGNGNFTNVNAVGSGDAYVPTDRQGTPSQMWC